MNDTSAIDFSRTPSFIPFSNPVSAILLYRYGLGFIFILGFTGNLASIITFLRPILRVTSTGLLFFILALSDTVFLLVSVFDFIEVGLTQGPILLAYYDGLCSFRWYLKGFIQFCSPWILVFITLDRWVRTRFPFKINKWCTRRNALIAVLFVVIASTGLHSHMLSAQLFAGFLLGVATATCGPADPSSSYENFYFYAWAYIQVVFNCLVPVVLMVVGAIDIRHVIGRTKRRIQPMRANQAQQLRQQRLHRQMLLLMISSIMIFLVTTLPVRLRQIVGAYQFSLGSTDLIEIINEIAILTVLLSFNYAINFYIHCLASKLFREEFIQFMKIVLRIERRVILVTAAGNDRSMMPPATHGIALVEILP